MTTNTSQAERAARSGPPQSVKGIIYGLLAVADAVTEAAERIEAAIDRGGRA